MAFILGLVGGVIPGPVLAATFTEILRSGFGKSIRIIGIAMAAETFVALASVMALSMLGLPQTVFEILSLVGAGILFWIAMQLWNIHSLDSMGRVEFGFWKIVMMILTNGVLWTYWITVCVPQAMTLGEHMRFGEYVFLFLVEIGWLISTLAVAITFSWFRNVLSHPSAVPLMFKLFSVMFGYFSLKMFWGSCSFLLTLL